MAVDSLSFGGWIVAWREFFLQDIDPFADFSSLHYGGTHEGVVHAVLADTVDAGTVRTDTLERMAKEGSIQLKQIKIIQQKQLNEFPFLLSTTLLDRRHNSL